MARLTALLLPGMLEWRHEAILNVASTTAFQPGPYQAVYCAAKAYVLSFTEALAEEVRVPVCWSAVSTARKGGKSVRVRQHG